MASNMILEGVWLKDLQSFNLLEAVLKPIPASESLGGEQLVPVRRNQYPAHSQVKALFISVLEPHEIGTYLKVEPLGKPYFGCSSLFFHSPCSSAGRSKPRQKSFQQPTVGR